MSSLFSSLNIAKSGMNVQQKAIQVTSHNLSNVNTQGYSRQQVVVKTANPMTVCGVGQVGMGAQVDSIIRIRDGFLDYQIMQGNSTYGSYNSKNEVLSNIEGVFNELSNDGISSKIDNFFNAFQELSKTPNSSFARKMVVEETASMCQTLNNASNQLDVIENNTNKLINSELGEINSLVKQISILNKDIIGITAQGNTPNDLMDQRDSLIEELSKKVNITVDKDNNNGVIINVVNGKTSGVPALVDMKNQSEAPNFSYITSIEKDTTDSTGKGYIISYQTGGVEGGQIKTLKISNLSNEDLQALEKNRLLVSDSNGNILKKDGTTVKDGETVNSNNLIKFTPTSGSLNGLSQVKDDINKYKDDLNKIAKAVAFSVNAVHSGVTDALNGNGNVTKDHLPFFVNSDTAKYDANGNLLNLDDALYEESNITAKNISINKEILTNPSKIKTKENDHLFKYTDENQVDDSGDGIRALEIANLKNKIFNIEDINESIFTRADMFDSFKGGATLSDGLAISNSSKGEKIGGFYKNIVSDIALRVEESDRLLKSQNNLLDSLETNRLSISGVSSDEEMANLIQFQHAYNANAKVLSTINDLLDVVINGLI